MGLHFWKKNFEIELVFLLNVHHDFLQNIATAQDGKIYYGPSMMSQGKTSEGGLQRSEGSFQGIFHLERPLRPLSTHTANVLSAEFTDECL